MKFPSISSKDLNGRQRTLPNDFEGNWNLLLIAYEQWQQNEVNTWLPVVDKLENDVDGFHYYELPVVGEMGMFGRMQLDYWMRNGIPDSETRDRTITLYTDQTDFRDALEIPDQEHIALLMLDNDGNVIWRGDGAYSSDTAKSLIDEVESLSARDVWEAMA